MLWVALILGVFFLSLTFQTLTFSRHLNSLFGAIALGFEAQFNYLLSDLQKQQTLQKQASIAIRLIVFLCLKFVCVGFFFLLPFLMMHFFSWMTIQNSLQFLFTWQALLVSLFSAIILWPLSSFLLKDFNSLRSVSSEPYPPMARMLQSLIFSSIKLQLGLNRLEKNIFGKSWESIRPEPPVFICGLPRSGSTIFLEALSRFPTMASLQYRDMPFILSPILWSKLSGPFQQAMEKKERAHGDGILISQSSPECFDEVLWKNFFPQKYMGDAIALWQKADLKFQHFFLDFQKRVILLRNRGSVTKAHYLSKNNANIARIPVLLEMFPEAIVLVMVRDPFEHALSLWKQHQRFSELHKKDVFSKKYMADIGHFEFGELHKKLLVPGFELCNSFDIETPDYWLAYWIASYDFLNQQEAITLISLDTLSSNGEGMLLKLNNQFNLGAQEDDIHKIAELFISAQSHPPEIQFDDALTDRAKIIYQSLLKKCLTP